MAAKRRFKDDECESNLNKRFSRPFNESNDEVQCVVREVVDKLVCTTDKTLNNSQINEQIHKSANNQIELDDSFKFNYDFSLIPNDALYNQFENSFTETTNLSTSAAILNQTATEHNYANVPTTSSTNQSSHFNNSNANKNNRNHSTSSRTIKSALKCKNDTINSVSTDKKKSGVKFKGITVFYFPRNQGGSTVPSQGGSTLGMEMKDCGSKNFTLDAHQEEKRQVHREILLRQKRYERLYQKQQARLLSTNQSDSDEDSLENISDISDSELDFDSWFFLQPVPVKQRRALLRESGITKIDSTEKEECRDIRLSREFCGCDCRVYCDPETCQCSLNGIKCQMDRLQFPCGCTVGSCNNINGRTEFNPSRVRTHFIHTMMRLELESTELEKKNENQSFNEDPLNSPHHHHTKNTNSSPSNATTNIEIMNQNTLFSAMSSNQAQMIDQQQYELKFTSGPSAQSNEIYPIESSNPNSLLNSNETPVNLPNHNYDDLYDSSDTGSSSYSENSDCTNDNLVTCAGLTATNGLTANCLTFGNLSPFSLISSVPTTSADQTDLLNGSVTLSYDNQNYHSHNSSTVTTNFLSADQSFRYYTSSLNSVQSHQMLTPTLTTSTAALNHDHQSINNHHLNPYYYQDTSALYGNLASIIGNDYTSLPPQQQEINSVDHLSNSKPLQTIHSVYNELSPQQSITATSSIVHDQQIPFDETHYTDLSESIATKSSELFATNNSPINHHFIMECASESNVVVNSSDDSSSSGQSLNANLEDNFGEIIKNTIHGVESVTA